MHPLRKWAVAAGCALSLSAALAFTEVPARVAAALSITSGRDGGSVGDWRNWDPDSWVRDAGDFTNPVIDGLWSPDRMRDSRTTDRPVGRDVGIEDPGVSDPEPAPVTAEPVPATYRANAPVVGKLFFDTPDGSAVCSATVVTDPAHPGASDLVWTAGHCVHAGARGGWFRNIVFVPSYNDSASRGADREAASPDEAEPFGVWWADWAETSPQWIAQGQPTGGKGSPADYAVLHVKPKAGSGLTSLEETVGSAARVSFDAPLTEDIPAIGIWGYPAAPPFDGELMFTCQGPPGRLSITADQPSLYRVGCTMTGGSSGGGWFALGADGATELISNTSIGPESNTWLAGPRLGEQARAVYEAVSEKFA